ncbi:MAG: S9 family peptidase [Clostridiales bacterium]|nr:S9 family peptidase [Clostridiales bacterium]MDO4349824.1 S9 family peptidase [Eubacteriales bacterium]MDY4007393.1 S9 family peptidase [Candidatus Limiplasma sp.]
MKTALMDLMDYRFAAAPKISPDGQACALLCYQAKADRSGYDSFVRVINPSSGEPLPYCAPTGCRSIAWLADGALAVALPLDGGTAIYALSANGGCAQWGALPFAATLEDGLCDGRLLLSAARPITAEKAAEDGHYTVLDEFPFWYDGRGYISKVRKQLFLMEKGAQPVRISPEEMDVAHAAYDASSHRIVYSGQLVETIRPDWDAVGCYDAASGRNTLPVSAREWRVRQVALLEGQPVLVASAASESYYAAPKVIRIREDGASEVLAAPEMHISNSVVTDVRYGAGCTLLSREDALYFVVTEGYGSQLYRMDASGAYERLTHGEGMVDGFDVRGGQVLFTGLRDMRLTELYRLENGAERALTCLNGGVQAPMPKDVSVVNSEGVTVYGLVRKPDVPPEKKCPGVLVIHGGPNGAFGHVFHHEMQMLCDLGYYVFCCNPTGSDGRGAAFGDVSGRWGTVDYDDLMRFTDKVLQEYPQIDPNRLCVFGGSYGGYMTNWIIGHTDRFCCAISDRSISNCPSKDVTGDNGIRFGEMHMKSNVYDDPAYMWDRSPLKYAYQVKTPTLFIHGEADTRCHLSQAMMMFTAIRENGVPARMAIFKGETHELCRSGKPRNRLRRLMEVQKWLSVYFSGEV